MKEKLRIDIFMFTNRATCLFLKGLFINILLMTSFIGMALASPVGESNTPTDLVPDNVEFQALKDIFQSLNGQNWSNKANWPTSWPASASSSVFGTWYGVTVVNGDITQINLTSNNLSGIIPVSIGNLTALTRIAFDSNSITGSIPTNIGSLSQLLVLYLQYNQLSGTIPSQLGNLSSLQYLLLSGNQLTGTIPGSLGNLSNLRYLHLVNNQLSGSIPTSIGSLTNLYQLGLTGNKLTGAIPTTLGSMTSLTHMYLDGNMLSGSIPSQLGSLSNLQVMYLQSNQLTGAIPSELGNLSSLQYLYLLGNQLSGSIPSTLGNLSSLHYMHLSTNQLSGSIPTSLGNLTNLNQLGLSGNQLTGAIPNSLGELSALTHMYLDGNRLSGSIPVQLGSLSNLQVLFLQGNQLSGAIPSELGSLSSLVYLYLYSNQFTGSIPSSFGGLSSLYHLYLQNNQLSGSIPSSLGNLTNLYQLGLTNNRLTGVIPSSLGSLSSLAQMDLDVNMLSGSIPAQLGNLSKLQVLFLQNNKLSGTIPAELGNLASLLYLSLASNQLSGAIPSTLSNLHSLVYLSLTANSLTSFPDFSSFPNKSALSIDISYNQIPFGYYESYFNQGVPVFQNLSCNYQTINLPTAIKVGTGNALQITLTNPGLHSTITWQKLLSNAWTNINNPNQSTDPTVFKITQAAVGDAGQYRVSISNTNIPGSNPSMSNSIGVSVADPKQMVLDDWAFQYQYDSRRRMIGKRVPGADWVYMVYDDRDRLVLTQDGNQRLNNQWAFTKYDMLNRPILTGIMDKSSAFTQQQMQDAVNAYYLNLSSTWGEAFVGYSGSNVHGYSNSSYPVETGSTSGVADPTKYLTVTYYDNYSFLSGDDIATYQYQKNDIVPQTVGSNLYFQPDSSNPNVKGQITGTKVRALDNNTYWLKRVNYYDDKLRVVQSLADHQRMGLQRTTTIYDFVGKVLAYKTATITQGPVWQNKTAVSANGNQVTTAAQCCWAAGASSVEQLTATQNGWVEATVIPMNSGNNNFVAFGLSQADANTNYNTIDYCWEQSSQTAYVYEKGNSNPIAQVATLPGDVLRIERTGTSVSYKKNGVVVVNSGTASTTPLLYDYSLYNTGSTLLNPRSSFSFSTSTVYRTFTYDHAGRLLQAWHSLDGATPVQLVSNSYNEIGQLVTKNLHKSGSTFKQKLDYGYNIRGWLTRINDSDLSSASNKAENGNSALPDLFGMNLLYEQHDNNLINTEQYNGNISSVKWSNNLGVNPTKSLAYNYLYDTLNRITSATLLTNPGLWTTSSNFSESGFKYDLNGNIKKLSRTDNAGAVMDMLTYDYTSSGNQLRSVTDGGDILNGFVDGNVLGDDYSYDANGNMIVDKNKNITSISYNYLNMPQTVLKNTQESLQYVYDATGRKLSQRVYDASNTLIKETDYLREYIYENDALQFTNNEEGRTIPGSFNAISNPDAFGTDGFVNYGGNVAMSSVIINYESYVKSSCILTGGASTPGIFPIGRTIQVQPGEVYTYRVKGYRTTSTNVYLYVDNGAGNDVLYPGALLPLGAPAEGWVTSTFTIPAGVTRIRVGLLFSVPSQGDEFYVNALSLTKGATIIPAEYQYHLKDHLGNVRTTFTTLRNVDTPVATFETTNQTLEQSQFLRMDDARVINASIFDHTHIANPGTTATYSERLSASPNEKTGIARSISVMPGDTINMEVYAKYVSGTNSSNQTWLTQLLGQIASNTASAGVVIDGTNYSVNGVTPFPNFGGAGEKGDNNIIPSAFLNYITFDRNGSPILNDPSQTNFVRISSKALEDGIKLPNGNFKDHEKLYAQVIVKQPGYMYIWLSNESLAPVEVYFDDFKVQQIKSPIVRQDDYYPFGLSFNSFTRESSVPQKYLYNGKELQTDLGLNCEDYGARMYMADIGRWGVIDGHSESYSAFSPYNYCVNNPTNLLDLFGLDPVYKDGKYYDNGKEVTWGYVYNWLQQNNKIGATYHLNSQPGKNAKISETKKENQGNTFYYNEKKYTANSLATLAGRDDNDNSVGAFTDIVSLTEDDIIAILGHGAAVIMDLYKGGVEAAALGESGTNKKLDYKNKAYQLLGINRNALLEINGTVYNANEAGNFLWGMVLEYHGSVISPNFAAQLKTVISDYRFDEAWEQRAIQSGRNFGISLTNKGNEFKRWILNSRQNARREGL